MKQEQILDRFDNVKPGGQNQFSARCPCHDDKKNSLAVGRGENGKTLICCHAGCATEDVLGAVGLTMADLYDDQAERPEATNSQRAEYLYANGQLRKKRFYLPDGSKSFAWEHLENGKWVKGKGNVAPGLYQKQQALPDTVFLVEGEKDVDTLAGLGIGAVSLPNGAGSKWDDAYADALRGKQVIILPDNDDAGRAYARLCAEKLYGNAESVSIAERTAVWEQMPHKADVSDLIQHFGPEEGQRRLAVAVVKACAWSPSETAGEDPVLARVMTLARFSEEDSDWVIPGWIPAGQITILASDGGVGKTTLWVQIAADLSRGRACILDPEGHTREKTKVLFLTNEDSIRKKLKKKLREAGADEEYILALDTKDDKTGLLTKVKFGSGELEKILRAVKPDLCIVDPLQGYIPAEINMASRNAMRSCLAPLVTLGEELETAFLIICHTNKRTGAADRSRLADSADIWDIARSVIFAGYTGDKAVRYLSQEKNNYTDLQETVLYGIDAGGKIVKKGHTWKRDRDFMQESATTRVAPQRRDCKDMILSILQREESNAIASKDLKWELELLGFSKTTVDRSCNELRAEKKIEFRTVGAAKKGNRQWYTALAGAGAIPEAEGRCQQMSCDDVPFA